MRIGIAMPAHLAAILASEAARHGHEVVFSVTGRIALAVALGERTPEAILVDASGEIVDEALLAATDPLGVRIVALAVERRDRDAERFGLPVLPAGADWSAIEAALHGVAPDVPSRVPGGAVVAVWGSAGAPGRTSTAIALAALLGEDDRALLIDADSHAPAVALALGLPDESAGVAAACRLAALDALDTAELQRLALAMPGTEGRAAVLTGLVRADRWPELSAERMRSVLEACRASRRWTVVDVSSSVERDEELVADQLAPRRNAATLTVLEAADLVVLVGTADPVGIARMIEASVLLPEHSRAPVVPVVVRMRSAAIGGLDARSQLVTTLERFGGVRDPVLVPLDQAAADRALRAALPLPAAAPRSGATAALRRLAAAVVERASSAVGEPSSPR